MKLTTLVAVLVVLMSAAPGDGCPSGAVYGENFDKCYIFVRESGTFEVAREICADYGGYLVSIQNAFENTFIVGHADEHFGNQDYWIGLIDPVSDEVWEWEDGSVAVYTNWATGFPIKSTALRCVASLGDKGKWYNTMCDNEQPNLVCEVLACPFGSVPVGQCISSGVCPAGYSCTTDGRNLCCPSI